jgi:hypothetical protein
MIAEMTTMILARYPIAERVEFTPNHLVVHLTDSGCSWFLSDGFLDSSMQRMMSMPADSLRRWY